MGSHPFNNLTGKTLGHYRLVREAGRGGMSTVYEAVDTRLGRTVALKVLEMPLSLLSGHEDGVARMQREARAIASLSHPNVVTIYDVGQEDDLHYLVMEFLDGVTLRDRLDQQALTPTEAAEILAQVADGLDAAHRAGVLHRDIKASNVMLLYNGRVKLLDFGIARGVEDATLTQVGSMVGSPPYLAPELITGGKATRASDLWAVGVLLYEMLSARYPFFAETTLSVLYRIANTEPDPLPHITPELRAVLYQALEKDPEARFPSGRALANAFQEAVALRPAVQEPVEEEETVIALPAMKAEEERERAEENALVVSDRVESREEASPALLTPSYALRREETGTDPALVPIHPLRPRPGRRIAPAALILTLLLIGGLFALSQFRRPRITERNTASTAKPVFPNTAKSDTPGNSAPRSVASKAGQEPSGDLNPRSPARVEKTNKTVATAKKPVASSPVSPASSSSPPSSRKEHQERKPSVRVAQRPATAASSAPRGNQKRPSSAEDSPRARQTTENEPDEILVPVRENRDEDAEPTEEEYAQADLRYLLNGWNEATNARDIEEQMRYYAPVLTAFYLKRNVPASEVRAEKRRIFTGTYRADIRTGEPTIWFSSDGRQATMRFRKQYVIQGGRAPKSGVVLQELRWQRFNDGWKIISERDLRVLSRG